MNFGNLISGGGGGHNTGAPTMSADIPLDVIMFVDELATYGKTGYVYNNDDIFAKTVRYKIALQNRATRDLVLEKVNQTANFEIFKNFLC